MIFFGELIAILTVLCWTGSVQFFEAASKRVGSTSVNIIRISLALVFFSLYLLWRDGSPLPLNFPLQSWLLLGLSGIVGFFLGDIFLFKALVEIGPRLAMLIFSLAAPAAAVIGWLFLGEVYGLWQWLGILVTLSGVAVVISERQPQKSSHGRTHRQVSVKGVLLGVGAMLGQAVGFILSKAGMQTEAGYLDAFAATQIRALAAFVCFLLFFTFSRRWGFVVRALADHRAVLLTSCGAIFGPFLGVSLSLLTLHYLKTGVASTFFSLVPVFIIPFSIFLHQEQVSLRAVLGAFTAVGGISLLMLG